MFAGHVHVDVRDAVHRTVQDHLPQRLPRCIGQRSDTKMVPIVAHAELLSRHRCLAVPEDQGLCGGRGALRKLGDLLCGDVHRRPPQVPAVRCWLRLRREGRAARAPSRRDIAGIGNGTQERHAVRGIACSGASGTLGRGAVDGGDLRTPFRRLQLRLPSAQARDRVHDGLKTTLRIAEVVAGSDGRHKGALCVVLQKNEGLVHEVLSIAKIRHGVALLHQSLNIFVVDVLALVCRASRTLQARRRDPSHSRGREGRGLRGLAERLQ
mmetsp:Transcript_55335/g.119018  ORF Transcript_55335/g.119018 Transcript_55335/m.119018 type:complete len:267 (-) Transcript_55335:798-1598(-)